MAKAATKAAPRKKAALRTKAYGSPVEQVPAAKAPSNENERMRASLQGLVADLEKDAESRVQKRSIVEKRWIKDLRQIEGEYEPDVLKELKDAGKSELFIGQTRSKTNACEARLTDMLFPTDDKNWGISPTPVPELDRAARDALAKVETIGKQANQTLADTGGDMAKSQAVAAQAAPHIEQATTIKAKQGEAKKRSEAMSAEIDDQLTECEYNVQARDVIRDGCRLGTGIMKGPVANRDRARRAWREVETKDAAGQVTGSIYQLEMVEDPRPAFYRVDPWSFFPETDARNIGESESFFERHLMTKKGLRGLARQPGFDAEALRRILRSEPSKTLPTYLTDLRGITGENVPPSDARYIVWEYRGPITAEQMRDVCACMGKDDMAKEAAEEADPLKEISVVLWFCEGEVLKFGIHHMDSGESIYSVYNLEKDDSSIWGFGIAHLMRDSQSALNAAWRMMMDNAGLASGPQIEIDTSVVEPADDEWNIVARKVWLRKKDAPAGKDGIKTHDIEAHQAEMAAIITLAKQLIDEETQISVLAQGEQGTHTTQTAQGMALLMNAVNVVFRRFVKNFDDDMTVPNIRRLYDWNMQFSAKPDIKGDFSVDARGTSVLLVREMQAQNLLVLSQFTGHPVLGLLLKGAALLRKLAQSMMIPADEIIKTDEELKDEFEAQKNAPKEIPPELETKLKIAQIDADSRLEVARINHQTQMMQLAEQRNMTIEELRTKLEIEDIKSKSSERKLAAEIAVETRAAATGRATGSGGYISAPEAAPA